MSSEQAVYFYFGSSISRRILFRINPSKFIISIIWPSPFSFHTESAASLFIGYCYNLGWDMACITVIYEFWALYIYYSYSIEIVIRSLMILSTDYSLTGTSNYISLVFTRGVSSSRVCAGRIFYL